MRFLKIFETFCTFLYLSFWGLGGPGGGPGGPGSVPGGPRDHLVQEGGGPKGIDRGDMHDFHFVIFLEVFWGVLEVSSRLFLGF